MFLGLTIAQWIVLAPRIIALVKFFVAMVIGYSVLNNTNPVTTAIDLLEALEANFPKPKKFTDWTKEELQAWWDNAGGGPPSLNGG